MSKEIASTVAEITKTGPGDPWAGEGSWRAIEQEGQECVPVPYERLYRVDDTAPEVLFRAGMPAPGGNFRLADQPRPDDAFYRASRSTGGAEDGTGPLPYLVVIEHAYGCPAGGYDVVVHLVPPNKIVAILDRTTGVVHVNPTLLTSATEATANRLKELYQSRSRGKTINLD